MLRHLTLLLLCLLPTVVGAKVYTPSDVPNVQVQDARQFVSDPEGYFTDEERASLNEILFNIREKHTAEVALVVLPDIEDDDAEGFTRELFEEWGIGKAIDDNGLLVLYKYGEAGHRIIRFEVGYGLEGALPDIATKRLTDRYIVPAIVEGRDVEGFLEAFQEVDNLLTEGYVARGENEVFNETIGEDIKKLGLTYLIFSVFVGILYGAGLISLWKKEQEPVEQLGVLLRRYNNQWWLVFIVPALIFLYPLYLILKGRTNRRLADCPMCHAKGSVHKLRKADNVSYLNSAQRAEEEVGSVHYPVYRCSECDYHRVIAEPRLFTDYRRCPHCSAKTYYLKERQQTNKFITQTFACVHCGQSDVRRIRVSNNSSGSFGGGFGSGGGSFGGGFGGGMSGGGGSTTRF